MFLSPSPLLLLHLTWFFAERTKSTQLGLMIDTIRHCSTAVLSTEEEEKLFSSRFSSSLSSKLRLSSQLRAPELANFDEFMGDDKSAEKSFRSRAEGEKREKSPWLCLSNISCPIVRSFDRYLLTKLWLALLLSSQTDCVLDPPF